MPLIRFRSAETARAGQKAGKELLAADPTIDSPGLFVECKADANGVRRIVAIHLEPGSDRLASVTEAVQNRPDHAPGAVLRTASQVLDMHYEHLSYTQKLEGEQYDQREFWMRLRGSLRTAWQILTCRSEDDVSLIPGYDALQTALPDRRGEGQEQDGVVHGARGPKGAAQFMRQLATRVVQEEGTKAKNTVTPVLREHFALLERMRKNLAKALGPPTPAEYSTTELFHAASRTEEILGYFLKQYPQEGDKSSST